MPIRHIMILSPPVCTPDMSVRRVVRLLLEHDRGALPVVERFGSREPVGIVTGLAITARLIAVGEESGQLRVRDVMEEPITVRPDARSADVWRRLEEESRGYALVVDESGDCIGVVAKTALAGGTRSLRDGSN